MGRGGGWVGQEGVLERRALNPKQGLELEVILEIAGARSTKVQKGRSAEHQCQKWSERGVLFTADPLPIRLRYKTCQRDEINQANQSSTMYNVYNVQCSWETLMR